MRRNNFDGVRLLGALLVLVSHQFALSGHTEPTLLGVTAGAAGVSIFFGISGFLITRSWVNDPNLWRFTARRLLRIWPAMAVVIGICSVAACWLERVDAYDRLVFPMFGQEYLRNLWFDHWDWRFFRSNPHGEMNGSLWTIPYEMLCYVAVAIAGTLVKRRVHWVAAAGLVASVFCEPGPMSWFGALFSAGAVLCLFPRRGAAIVVAAAAVSAVVQPPLGLTLAIALVAVEIGLRSTPGLRDAGRFGDLSYGMYLWAWPVQQLGVLALGVQTPLPVLLATSVTYTAALAWLSWHLVEAPALKLKPRAAASTHRRELGGPQVFEHTVLTPRRDVHGGPHAVS